MGDDWATMDQFEALDQAARQWATRNGQTYLGGIGNALRFRAPDGHEWTVRLDPEAMVGALLNREAATPRSACVAERAVDPERIAPES